MSRESSYRPLKVRINDYKVPELDYLRRGSKESKSVCKYVHIKEEEEEETDR